MPLRRSRTVVPSYQTSEDGTVVCVPVHETALKRCCDGSAFELRNLMLGQLPETLAQIQMTDQMQTAEIITTHCVRRFGELSKQRDELEKKFNSNDE